MTRLRYGVRVVNSRYGFTRFFVVDYQTGLDASGYKLSERSAQDEADRLNGALLRSEVELRGRP